MASLYYAASFNPHTEQTAHLILESDCRWVAALAGFSLSIYQTAWARVRLSVHRSVSINPFPANTRSNVWFNRLRHVIMCSRRGMDSNKLPFTKWFHMCISEKDRLHGKLGKWIQCKHLWTHKTDCGGFTLLNKTLLVGISTNIFFLSPGVWELHSQLYNIQIILTVHIIYSILDT